MYQLHCLVHEEFELLYLAQYPAFSSLFKRPKSLFHRVTTISYLTTPVYSKQVLGQFFWNIVGIEDQKVRKRFCTVISTETSPLLQISIIDLFLRIVSFVHTIQRSPNNRTARSR